MLKSDGAMYRVLNTIMVLMVCYMKTKDSNGSDVQDTRNPKGSDWEMLQKTKMTKVGVNSNLDQPIARCFRSMNWVPP